MRLMLFLFVGLGTIQGGEPGRRDPDAPTDGQVVLQGEQLGVRFDRATGTLQAIDNRLTGETYGIEGDKFALETVWFCVGLSVMSSSPNQCYSLPTKTGIPEEDKAELRRWFDWGRKHAEYLKVRKDLPGWPAPGKVDGSAHLLGDHGLVFLFKAGPKPLPAEFTLSGESIGLTARGNYRISRHYPATEDARTAQHGETVRWQVPAETARILKIKPIL